VDFIGMERFPSPNALMSRILLVVGPTPKKTSHTITCFKMEWGRALIRALKISVVTQDYPMDVKTVKKLYIRPIFHLGDGSIVLLWSPFLWLLFRAMFLLFSDIFIQVRFPLGSLHCCQTRTSDMGPHLAIASPESLF
jgi:hypothetical protein